MLINAILMKILSVQPWALAHGMLILLGVVSLGASLLPAVAITLLEQTRKARAIRRGEVTQEAQRQIDRWKLRALSAELENRALRAWKSRAQGLLEEARNHNRNENADIGHLVTG